MPALDLLPYLPAALLAALGWLLVSWVRGQERRVSVLEKRLDDEQKAVDEALKRLAVKMDDLGEAFAATREKIVEVTTIVRMLRDRNGGGS